MYDKSSEIELFASCVAGLENLLADELKSFDIRRVRPLRGGVSFFCDVERAYRACLWSRLASRIALVVGRVDAGDADLLYAGVYGLPWEDIVEAGASMAVRAHGTNAELRNTRFTTLKVKDAIVDRLRAKRDERPDIDTQVPRAAVDVRVHDRKATVSLDFSGEALSHRGYLSPDDSQDAALATTLSAGILALAGWDGMARAGAAFVDPVCGDGILVTEAAAIACDMAPGIQRERWGFFGWAKHDDVVWQSLAAEADERFEAGLARMLGTAAGGEDDAAAPSVHVSPSAPPDLSRVRIVGATSSSPAVSRARDHVKRAGLRAVVSIEIGDAESAPELVERAAGVATAQLRAHHAAGAGAVCLVASNLSARAGRAADERAAEATFMAAAGSAPEGSTFVAANAQDVAARFGCAPAQIANLGDERIETTVELFADAPVAPKTIEVPDAHGGAPHTVEVFEETSDQFAARLRKVYKERRKWSKREGVSCYRLYDADLPGYAVAIDVYEGAGHARGNTYLHISEYAAPSSVDEEKARHRFNDVLAIAPVVCEVRPDHVFSKTRLRDKGGSQYRNAGRRSYVTQIEENGYLFEVDLAGRLDTGIFLDHRDTRKLVEGKAHGKRFANLFAYTGTASVYAAGGGASSTVTVDLSQNYLDWARRNMAQNGFSGPRDAFEHADVMRWITEARRAQRRFDLIFVDPPTFSNSKSMGHRTWDVQRDHVELLIGVTHLLADGGEAIFSCNLRSFKPYVDDLAKYGVEIEDISASTIPADFARTPKIHKCYLVRRA